MDPDGYHRLIDDVVNHNSALFHLRNTQIPKDNTNIPMSKAQESMTDRGLTENEFLCTPPSFLQSKPLAAEPPAKRFKIASNSETLNENDISDSELCEYLRGPDEIQRVLEIRKRLDEVQ